VQSGVTGAVEFTFLPRQTDLHTTISVLLLLACCETEAKKDSQVAAGIVNKGDPRGCFAEISFVFVHPSPKVQNCGYCSVAALSLPLEKFK
jgi:hypothetical protein